jgi:hypothetical protein
VASTASELAGSPVTASAAVNPAAGGTSDSAADSQPASVGGTNSGPVETAVYGRDPNNGTLVVGGDPIKLPSFGVNLPPVKEWSGANQLSPTRIFDNPTRYGTDLGAWIDGTLHAIDQTGGVGIGGAFTGKSAQQIGDMFIKKGFSPRGPDPISGFGGYVNPKNGRSYHIDFNTPGHSPHVDVNRLPRNTPELPKKRLPIYPP